MVLRTFEKEAAPNWRWLNKFFLRFLHGHPKEFPRDFLPSYRQEFNWIFFLTITPEIPKEILSTDYLESSLKVLPQSFPRKFWGLQQHVKCFFHRGFRRRLSLSIPSKKQAVIYTLISWNFVEIVVQNLSWDDKRKFVLRYLKLLLKLLPRLFEEVLQDFFEKFPTEVPGFFPWMFSGICQGYFNS